MTLFAQRFLLAFALATAGFGQFGPAIQAAPQPSVVTTFDRNDLFVTRPTRATSGYDERLIKAANRLCQALEGKTQQICLGASVSYGLGMLLVLSPDVRSQPFAGAYAMSVAGQCIATMIPDAVASLDTGFSVPAIQEVYVNSPEIASISLERSKRINDRFAAGLKEAEEVRLELLQANPPSAAMNPPYRVEKPCDKLLLF